MQVVQKVADLQVTDVAVSSLSVKSNEKLNVSWTVKNLGARRTDVDLWYDRVYLSVDTELGGNDILLGSFEHKGVLEAVGGTGVSQYQVSKDLKLPIDLTGNFHILVETDAPVRKIFLPLEVHEIAGDYLTGELNNFKSSAQSTEITLGAVPNLVMANVDAPQGGVSGQTMKVSWTVRNDGASTQDTRWFDGLYLSSDPIFDAATDISLGSFENLKSLNPGESYTQEKNVKVPQGLTGNFYVLSVADVTQRRTGGLTSGLPPFLARLESNSQDYSSRVYERLEELDNLGYDPQLINSVNPQLCWGTHAV